MSDNAAPGDRPESHVHPQPADASPAQLAGTTVNIDALGTALQEHSAAQLQQEVDVLEDAQEDLDGFDPATLANLAALSRIAADEDGEVDAEGDYETEGVQAPQDVSDVPHESSDVPGGAKWKRASKGPGRRRDTTEDGSGQDEENDDDDDRDELSGEEGDYRGPKYIFENGRFKRKRNRTTVSCTECHRRKQLCDRNIPCTRCVQRGVPGMCRMEAPLLSEKKPRKYVNNVPLNYELGIRVQALESLIRNGSSLDPDSAQTAAMETILHATRAANSGSEDANAALAQLSASAADNGISSMSAGDQSAMLMNVLQQLSSASTHRTDNVADDDADHGENSDPWSIIPTARFEGMAGTTKAYEADISSTKLNLSIPGFREDNGRLFVPPTVRNVLERKLHTVDLISQHTLPIEGHAGFLDLGLRFAYGTDSIAYGSKRIAALQAPSLTGALRIAGTFLARFPLANTARTVYLPHPTSDEDVTVLRDTGMEIRYYRFVNRQRSEIDWQGMQEDLQNAPAKSTVLLHVGGGIPTGMELSPTQWLLIIPLLQKKGLIPLVTMTSQGLASGDPTRDAHPLRAMVQDGLPVMLIQSFDATLGLYADSPAILSIVTQSAETRGRLDTQLRAIARTMYLHPSPLGAHLVHTVLSDSTLFPAWLKEIQLMSGRLKSIREKLFDTIANKLDTPGSDWLHLKRSNGMYCTILLPPAQVESLCAHRHIHILPHGCISLGSLDAAKIDLLARGVDQVVREGIREAEEASAQQLAEEFALVAAREQAAKDQAEVAARHKAAEDAAAREEDTLLMERSIQNAIEAQRRAEEEEKRREEKAKRAEAAMRRAAERAEIARQAEAILATIKGL